MSVETGSHPDLNDLYFQFNREHGKHTLRSLPFGALLVGNAVVGTLSLLGNDAARQAYQDAKIWLPQLVTGIASFPFFLQGAGWNENRKPDIIAKIAEAEGRHVQSLDDRLIEERRVEAILGAFKPISPSLLESSSFDVKQALGAPINGFFRLLGASKEMENEVTESLQKKEISGHFASAEITVGMAFEDEATRKDILTRAFELVRLSWQDVISNPRTLEDRRKYARLMLSEINSRLGESQPEPFNSDSNGDDLASYTVLSA